MPCNAVNFLAQIPGIRMSIQTASSPKQQSRFSEAGLDTMQEGRLHHEVRIDDENLSRELRLFTEELENDIMELLRCDEILGAEIDEDMKEDFLNEEIFCTPTYQADLSYKDTLTSDIAECFCDVDALWNRESIWTFPQSITYYYSAEEYAKKHAGVIRSSCAVLFWGW